MNSWLGFGAGRAWNGMVAAWTVVVLRAALHALGQDSPNPSPFNSLPGAVYNITLVTDSAPDLTDIDSYLRSITYPNTMQVEVSADGNSFAVAGSAGFNQVLSPPADYVPWELDQAAVFENPPAGGRWAYAYRVLCDHPVIARYVRITCGGRKGWGVLLSEVQVFGRVTMENNVPPLVVLPPARGTGN